ncbi:LuxR family transcriptional regulator [Rhodobacteraceae bacterium CCMM004]|nr:LuxR family transcriptional regulator [Rhodobacteraceae bacterium CCMM004]
MDHLHAVMEARTGAEVWQLHLDRMAHFGFDRLLYGFTRFRTAQGFGDREDLLILSNHPPAYLQRFVEDGLYDRAPMVRWASENSGACSWRWMAEHRDILTPDELSVVTFNIDHGITAGYSISFPDASLRNKGAIGLTARAGLDQDDVDAIWRRHGREIYVANCCAHLRLINLPYPASGRVLTPRQREVLEWVRDGKTMQDIAAIMGLTVATVEKHLRLARAALDVDTTAQAMLKASFQHQIFVLER